VTTLLGGLIFCDSIPTSENAKKPNKERKEKEIQRYYQRRNSTKSRKSQTQQVFVSFIFPQVDTFSKGIFESDGDSTVEFLRVERTPSEGPLNREDGQAENETELKRRREE
jgi:hypothetical protein